MREYVDLELNWVRGGRKGRDKGIALGEITEMPGNPFHIEEVLYKCEKHKVDIFVLIHELSLFLSGFA